MRKIKLTQGYYTLVDDWNYEWLNQWKWCYDDGYASRSIYISKGKRKHILMHRLIMNTPKGMMTDHKDMCRWNNQEHNLRIVDRSQNGMNREGNKNSISKYKGVTWVERDKVWHSQIMFKGKRTYIGGFSYEEGAARAYDKKAKELFGEYARLNFRED